MDNVEFEEWDMLLNSNVGVAQQSEENSTSDVSNFSGAEENPAQNEAANHGMQRLKEWTSLKNELRSIVLSAGIGGVALSNLDRDYRDLNGRSIDYDKFGFHTLPEMLSKMKDVIRADGEQLFAISSSQTKHLEELISQQCYKPPTRFGGVLPTSQQQSLLRGKLSQLLADGENSKVVLDELISCYQRNFGSSADRDAKAAFGCPIKEAITQGAMKDLFKVSTNAEGQLVVSPNTAPRQQRLDEVLQKLTNSAIPPPPPPALMYLLTRPPFAGYQIPPGIRGFSSALPSPGPGMRPWIMQQPPPLFVPPPPLLPSQIGQFSLADFGDRIKTLLFFAYPKEVSDHELEPTLVTLFGQNCSPLVSLNISWRQFFTTPPMIDLVEFADTIFSGEASSPYRYKVKAKRVLGTNCDQEMSSSRCQETQTDEPCQIPREQYVSLVRDSVKFWLSHDDYREGIALERLAELSFLVGGDGSPDCSSPAEHPVLTSMAVLSEAVKSAGVECVLRPEKQKKSEASQTLQSQSEVRTRPPNEGKRAEAPLELVERIFPHAKGRHRLVCLLLAVSPEGMTALELEKRLNDEFEFVFSKSDLTNFVLDNYKYVTCDYLCRDNLVLKLNDDVWRSQ